MTPLDMYIYNGTSQDYCINQKDDSMSIQWVKLLNALKLLEYRGINPVSPKFHKGHIPNFQEAIFFHKHF